jgi:hypothetical protein
VRQLLVGKRLHRRGPRGTPFHPTNLAREAGRGTTKRRRLPQRKSASLHWRARVWSPAASCLRAQRSTAENAQSADRIARLEG